jgi:rare lipoprotein A
MNNIMRFAAGITVFFVIIVFSAGCTPGSAQAKKTPAVQKSAKIADAYDEEISFEDDGFEEPAVKSRTVSRNTDNQGTNDALKRDRFFQTGKASWYGREFHGKTTASGDKFNMYDMTAAHKTLPFGTIIEVTSLDTGKSVEVRVNDRGPYRGQRVLDLSYNAAKNLGMVKEGEAMVGIKIVQEGGAPSGRTAAEPKNSGKNVAAAADFDTEDDFAAEDDSERRGSSSRDSGFSVQAGAFYSSHNANSLKSRIEDITRKKVNVVRDGDFYKVRIDGINSKKEAASIKRELQDNSIDTYVIER